MGLYQTHRPTQLTDVKGNGQVISSLTNLLAKKNKPQVYLLHGPTGCGKTTIGRIIFSELGVTGRDLVEINSANFRGIDTAREIIQNAGYKPMESAARGYLIDEAHRLTKDAQNALLKFLEDTPKDIYIVMCTTDPGDLIPTFRNRCIDLQVNLLNEREMRSLLVPIVKSEGKTIEKEVITQIIESAAGHPRKAIQILETVLETSPELQLQAAKKIAEEKTEAINLARILSNPKSRWSDVAPILRTLKAADAETIRRVVLGYAQAILLNGDNLRAAQIMEEFLEPTYNSGFPQITFACYSIIKT